MSLVLTWLDYGNAMLNSLPPYKHQVQVQHNVCFTVLSTTKAISAKVWFILVMRKNKSTALSTAVHLEQSTGPLPPEAGQCHTTVVRPPPTTITGAGRVQIHRDHLLNPSWSSSTIFSRRYPPNRCFWSSIDVLIICRSRCCSVHVVAFDSDRCSVEV